MPISIGTWTPGRGSTSFSTMSPCMSMKPGSSRRPSTYDVGILDRLVADLGDAAVFDPDGAVGDDAVAQDNFEFTQPHIFSLALLSMIFSENRFHFRIMLRIVVSRWISRSTRPATSPG